MMQWLTLWFALQSGLFSQTMRIAPINQGYIGWSTPPNTIEATMEARVLLFEHIELAGFMRSYQVPADITSFAPFRIDYGASASIIYGPLRIGVKHECDHPVSQVGSISLTDSVFASQSTSLFIRFESKINF